MNWSKTCKCGTLAYYLIERELKITPKPQHASDTVKQTLGVCKKCYDGEDIIKRLVPIGDSDE